MYFIYFCEFIIIAVICGAVAEDYHDNHDREKINNNEDSMRDDYYFKHTKHHHTRYEHGVKIKSSKKSNIHSCSDRPVTPINGALECSLKNCRAFCAEGHQFPNGETQLIINCHGGEWQIVGTEWTAVPHCEPICLPQCQNNGICISPNECQCQENFSGPRCQYENKPCLNRPPPVQNSKSSCTTKICTIACNNKFVFPDGSSITNLLCKNGDWTPARADWVSIPDCKPTCSPPCQNGGICLSLNKCQCPQDFRGPECQYPAASCSPKNLGFNGGYQCRGDESTFSCKLNCPIGIEFSSPPASEYVCSYEKGIFEPQPIPQCKISPDYQIIPLESMKNTFYKITNHSWTIEGTSMHVASYDEYESDVMKYRKKIMTNIRENDVHHNQTFESFYGEDSESKKQLKLVPRKCVIWGGTHYNIKTFDGEIYSFDSNCAHTLIEETQAGLFTITIQNSQECQKNNDLSEGRCHRVLKIFLEGKEYILQLNDVGNPELRTIKEYLPIPVQLTGIRVEMSGEKNRGVIVSLDWVGVNIKWNGDHFVEVEASETLWKKVAGLCGRLNGDHTDDMTTRDHSHPQNIADFVSSWKILNIGEICDENPVNRMPLACHSNPKLFDGAKNFCEELFPHEKVSINDDCHINYKVLQSMCQWDFCACQSGDTEEDKRKCACDTKRIYLRSCTDFSTLKSVDWRHQDQCPMNCTGGKIYRSCGPTRQSTCTTQLTENIPEDCEEGCFCPENTVLHEDKCIPVEACPCILRGKSFPAGASIRKNCNTCTCSSGKWVCTEVTCSARCSVIGDPHYVTFDKKHYDFMGKCNYYLVKGDNYSIETENVACSGAISESMGLSRSNSGEQPSCTKSVTIRLNETSIKLKQNHQILINGEDVTKLPLSLSGAKIRIASSIFIVVSISNGMEVWWDSVSRVYINAPPKFRGKTQGLCGTFTANQKDDFLTPYGDIENAVVPFANKWKTTEQCNDLPMEESIHPCSINPEKATTAEKYCSKLFSSIFSECHWYVDPHQFYEDCKYDMCACESNIDRCLCPTLATYAAECAAGGIKILWRTEFEECKIHCPSGQEYQICGNSCTRSCSDISFYQECRSECIEGCNCPEGQTLNNQNECVPIGQCPCQHNGVEFNAGYREIRPGTKGQDLCTCGSGVWTCRQASSEEIGKYPEMIDLKTLCRATKNLEATNCENAEPKTCRNMHKEVNQSPAICRPGCVCKKGYVLDLPSGDCIEEKKCPCYHGGKSYKEGSTMQEDCNTCKCHGGKWKCTDRICPGVCSAWGDSHFKTFDDKTFNFQGVCDYVLAKASFGDDDCFQVSIQNVLCGSTGVSCSKSVSLIIGNGANQEIVTLTRGKDNELGKTFKRIIVRKSGLFIFLDVPDLGLVLQWDQGTRVYVKLDRKWKGRTKGLCGDYNDNNADDFKTPSGGISEASAQLFGDSWKKDNFCPEPKDITDTCILHPERKLWAVEKCEILKSPLFQSCHSEVDVEDYIRHCIFDTCGCDSGGDCECLCTALAAYAYECNRKGIPVKWRSQDLCPMQCDETCSTYSPCISTCPPKTCDNFANGSPNCAQDTCVEGCLLKQCPEGQVYSNNSLLECVPVSTCKPICTEINNITYYEGDAISSDTCQTCFCSRGKIICNGAPCTTQMTLPTTIPMEESEKCVDGWTEWINTNIPKSSNEKMFSDIEPLPPIMTLLTLKNSARCLQENMIDIECRTTKDHKYHKEIDLDVECDLQHGLRCQSKDAEIPCEDFEIRVLCQCSKISTLPTIPSTSVTETSTIITVTNGVLSTTELNNCDINDQYQPHPTNCRVFYQCISTFIGTQLIEKPCGPGTMYNPVIQTCDWPYNVIKIRPECAQVIETTTKKPSQCKDGEKWDLCAIKCNRTCESFYHILTEKNLCSLHHDCIPGCVNDNDEFNCPPHKLWRDEHTCVEISDCPCITHNKTVIKPGVVVTESECERCQCLSNYYTCDKSLCTTFVPTTSIVSTSEVPTTEDNSVIIVKSTVSPAISCLSQHYTSLFKNSETDEIVFNASSWLGSDYSPELAKMTSSESNSIPEVSFGWQPKYTDSRQWFDIQFPRLTSIYGIIMKGNPLEDKFITSYRVLFSQNGDTFSYILDDIGIPFVFQGPIDSLVPTTEILREPIEAKVVRIIPDTWHNGISMKIDLLGCENDLVTEKILSTTLPPISSARTTVTPFVREEISKKPICVEPMGINSGIMLDDQMSASTSVGNLNSDIRLSSESIWRPTLDNPNQYVQFDFLQNRNITGIQTKGLDGVWTTAFKVFYADDVQYWSPVIDSNGNERIFSGNYDDKTVKVNYFDAPISAKYLKIQPVKWHNHVGLKAEILGCFIPYPPREVHLVKIIEPKSRCNLCHSIFEEYPEFDNCKCNNTQFWNGESCVEKQQCPCVVDHISYAVGTSFETNDCQKCTCGMGGTPDCHPKKCPPCNKPDMASVVTELCGCVCKPCLPDFVLCPSVNKCIQKSLWCNGVKDCPDDETNCVSNLPEQTKDVTTNTKTVVVVTTVETKNVTKFQCEQPECPEGYKLIPMKKQPIKNFGYTPFNKGSNKAFNDGVKGGLKGRSYGRRIAKEPRKNDHHAIDNESSHEVECQQFSCKPIQPPLVTDVNKKIPECPKIECPPDYRVVLEPKSMYELTPCPKYICKPPEPRDVTCNVTSRTFNTFDNVEYKYDICNHILAREMFGNKWYITLEKHCHENSQHCSKVLAIVIDNDVVVLYPDMHVDINEFTFTARQLDYLHNLNTNFKICRIGDFLHFSSRYYGFWVIWDQNSDVKIGITTTLAHHVDGLCGYFDGIAENDRQKPDGSRALTSQEFGDSWVMDGTTECEKQDCPRHILVAAKDICNTLEDGSFGICRNVIDVEKHISQCLESTCLCLTQNGQSKDDCRCRALTAFAADCQSADFNAELSTWRSIQNCPIYCPAPFVWKDCFRNKCETTCENLKETEPCPLINTCFSGCFCPENTVRSGATCVSASECRDCSCSSFGNSNFLNFNKKNFTFNGNCTYVLSQDIVRNIDGKIGDHAYKILVTNVPCERGVCTESLTILYKGHFLQIQQLPNIQYFVGTLDGEPLEIPMKNTWISVEKDINNDVTLLIPAIQLEVISYWHNFGFMIKLPSHIFGGALEGLCGNCNLNDDEKFIKSDGQTTEDINEFGLSWLETGMPESRYSTDEQCINQLTKKCDIPPAHDDPCMILQNPDIFGQCNGLVDPSSFLQSCHDSLCENGNVCGDLEAYGRKCREMGLCPDWRKPELCPLKCPIHLQYQACGPCTKKTCDNLNEVGGKECEIENVEGCYCPKNHVLRNKTCIPEKMCFVCDDQGHIEGDTWNVDKCTTCTCHNKIVSCQTKECPAVDTICDDNFSPVIVSRSENECCSKYLCVPIPTVAPTCVEPQQPECGYGQIMKLITSPDGCRKFICQCLPADQCPSIADSLSSEVEKTELQPGFVQIVNSTGCCPRAMITCQPETCPTPPKCQKYYEMKIKQEQDSCCPTYECEPPKDLCLYTSATDNSLNNEIIAKKIGDTWQDSPCITCTCEKSLNDYPKAACIITECQNIQNHPDINDYVLEEKVLIDQCCPWIQRIACKENGNIYNIGDEWYPYSYDICVTAKCQNTTSGIQKTTFTKQCNNLCDFGYEYKSPDDKNVQCCGECVPVACIINGTMKYISESWHSDDYCVNYECLNDEKNVRVKESVTQCESIDSQVEQNFVIEAVRIPHSCCPKYIKTACKRNGKIYTPGMTWRDDADNCVTGKCVKINEEIMEVQKTFQSCNETCEFGWEYQMPEGDQCCGRCKPAFCIYEGALYNPGTVWYSSDNCTTYECQNRDDQPMVSTSTPVCPDVSQCPLEDIYNDGCCNACNLTTLDMRRDCMAEVLELDTTVNMISEKRGIHGVCRNLQAIDDLTECHGSCKSSTYFNHVTWIQETDCQCCQPTEVKAINIDLTCEDGKVFPKTIYVPVACSCNACRSSVHPRKARPTEMKIGLKT